jgi:hypothetical protein
MIADFIGELSSFELILPSITISTTLIVAPELATLVAVFLSF